MPAPFDLAAYLRRIGLPQAPPATLAGLAALHRAHVMAIPFENLDIQLGAGVSLDPERLQAALVHRRRGGYCFQQNGLLAMALGAIGIPAETCEARVRPAGAPLLPRTHMVLRVALEGRTWLADVGFGGEGLVEPAPMDGTAIEQLGATYRVVEEPVSGRRPLQVLQTRAGEGWLDLYAVLPDPAYPIDFEVANWYTSTWPASRFVQTVTAQRVLPDARHILRNLTYTVIRGGRAESREIDRRDLVPLLRSVFGLDIDPDARFVALDGGTVRCVV